MAPKLSTVPMSSTTNCSSASPLRHFGWQQALRRHSCREGAGGAATGGGLRGKPLLAAARCHVARHRAARASHARVRAAKPVGCTAVKRGSMPGAKEQLASPWSATAWAAGLALPACRASSSPRKKWHAAAPLAAKPPPCPPDLTKGGARPQEVGAFFKRTGQEVQAHF